LNPKLKEGKDMSTKLAVPSSEIFGKMHLLLAALVNRPLPEAPPSRAPNEPFWPRPRKEPLPGKGQTPSPSKDRRSDFPLGQGQPLAMVRMLEKLEPQVVRIVRRAMGQKVALSPLTQRIHDLARTLEGGPLNQGPEEREALVRQVARHICQSLKTHVRS
jgi:hypothetical protein